MHEECVSRRVVCMKSVSIQVYVHEECEYTSMCS